VLNNATNLREETRQRVLAAMVELDYRPNNAARALGTATTRTLGVVATDVTLYGPTVAIAALAAAARDEGRWVASAYANAADEESVDAAVAHVLGQGVDGIVLVAPHARTRDAIAARTLGVPIVVMHGGTHPEGTGDRQAEGAALIVDHLVSLGHRRIARVGGPPDWLEETSREAGFRTAMTAHELQPGPSWVGDWSAESAAALAPGIADAVGSKDGPTGIVVANDQMALGLMSCLRDRGIDVPGDISVAGIDDNPDAAYYVPPLTTVRLDIAGEARRCVAEAFGADGVTGPDPAVLVQRSSTAPPR
jgi:DNA-binding LacI/PurR family transcriptional regulator